ncbi:efflux RND transporter permease subunit [Hydrogenimonas thermophila]|uniref:efflux RND transporter permease subunit n=1 Tax=Hydrogenimonas thermophila TaxID=223786 RepID=UPI00293707DE|nr:efflux RND transporter permease subunit [Hydrogenimonas thermophila]WOE71159.1 efflux RND transporter permease subunit [Hydrogenimonas thermophila]WOE73677.1 efflux RND transporter permease subunit [Hydrogenimonas thermophila]
MIEKFIRFAIEKPILNHIFLVFLLALSVFAYINIPKEIFPPGNLDRVTITGHYTGASADLLDKMAVHTIEDGLKNLSEIDVIESVIKNGTFIIGADIKPGNDPDITLSDAKDIISNIRRDLPSDMDEPVAKIAKRNFPLVIIAVAADKPKKELLKVADAIKSDLAGFKDLSDIVIYGDADDELDIFINSAKVDALGLSKHSVVSVLSQLASIFPVGAVKQRGKHLFISTINGEKDLKELKNTILHIDGKTLFLKDIAEVKFQLSEPTEISHFNGIKNVSISVSKSEEGNAIALSKDIRKLLANYKEKYPEFTFDVYTDTSIWIKNRLNTVVSNIIFGLGLVFLSMLLFVNARIALVVAIGIPVSFMIGLVASEILGYSLNMLTLLGALIALGMLVDEAIVVAENIYRYIEEGMEPKEAAIKGSVEMFPAVLTATMTTVFAFLPLLMLSGKLGEFIKVLPVMITILLLSSLFEAFYFLPLHAKDMLKPTKELGFSQRFWQKNYQLYRAILSPLIRYKYISLPLLVGSILFTTWVFASQSRFQLFPEFDTTQIYVNGEVDINNKLEDNEKIVSQIEKVLLENLSREDVSSITAVIGLKLDSNNKGEHADNLFHLFVNLHEPVPKNFFDKYINPYLSPEYDSSDMIRKHSAQEIAAQIQKLVEPFKKKSDEFGKLFKEINVIVPQAGIVKSDIELSFGGESKKVAVALERVKNALAKIKGVENITDDAKPGVDEYKLKINRYGQELGFTEGAVVQALQPFFLEGEYAKMFNNEGLVRIRLQDSNKDSLKRFEHFELQVPGELRFVSLKDIVDIERKESLAKIFKVDGKRVSTVYASLDKKFITSAEVMEKLSPIFEDFEKNSISVDIKGEEKENRRVKTEIIRSAVIAIFLIFVALVWMFDSIALPLITLSTIPLSILGVLIGHKVMGLNLTMPSLIGIVGLCGVVVNDGLIMIDFIKNAKSLDELLERAKLRLRPILLTSLTTVLGLSSLIFFASGQALILQPMAITLGFGLIWATILNLYYVPLLYSVLYRIKI